MSTIIPNTTCKMVDLTMIFRCLKLLTIFILQMIMQLQLVFPPKVCTILFNSVRILIGVELILLWVILDTSTADMQKLKCYVAGFGAVEFQGETSQFLKSIHVNTFDNGIIKDDTCKQAYSSYEEKMEFCAG